MAHDVYEYPLLSRYSSWLMQNKHSPDFKFRTWRELWRELARCEKELGVQVKGKPISNEAIAQMGQHLDMTEEDYRVVAEEEARNLHDVQAHIVRFAQLCPAAAGIIHHGGTSCFVTDNTDLIVMRDSFDLIIKQLARVINRIRNFALLWKSQPALGYTHLQTAQPVTVGKRTAMWLWDLCEDFKEIQSIRGRLLFRGGQGTTGTQDTYLEIFENNHEKVKTLNLMLAQSFNFNQCYPVTGQTYSRKVDQQVLVALSGLGSSLHKIFTDLRLLQAFKEIEEPFGDEQVGSTNMPYKRNPRTTERGCALSRQIIAELMAAYFTHMNQWLERTLDDSAGKRIYVPAAFLCADAALNIIQFLFEGLVVYPAMINRHLREELPFMVTGKIIIAMVRTAGANRQECHERLRVLSQQASDNVKLRGLDNDLIARILTDDFFTPIHGTLDEIMDPTTLIGRSPEIVDEFITEQVDPLLAPYAHEEFMKEKAKIHV